MMVKTLHGEVAHDVMEKFAKIKLLVCDVDGVFSDGRIYLGNNGEELKAFHTRDGFGFKAIKRIGIQTAVITGRKSTLVEQRMSSLNTTFIVQGCEQKQEVLQKLMDENGYNTEHVASMGDDVPDIGMFSLSGLGIAVADAHPLVLQKADWVTRAKGGFGAVREVCDLLLAANNALDDFSGVSG